MFSAHIPANEQKIVLATLAFHIHDLMVDQVKEYKRSIDTTASDKVRSDDTPVATFYESSTSLLRYGGFALPAMIKKRKKEVSTVKSHLKSECQLLESMKAKEDEHEQIPSAIHHLQQGGLTIVSPKMLPLLREVLRKTASLVNETSCKEYGKNMLQVAKTEFTSEATTTAFFKLFTECLPSTRTSTLSTECHKKLCNEFTLKIFHARINEHFSASEEIELEQSGKVVKAEQGLRDSLKSFSSLKSRPY